MPDPIRIPLPAFHQARLASINNGLLNAQQAVAVEQARREELLSAVVGMTQNASGLAKEGWTAGIDGDCIVLTPPTPPVPQLVPDIGPDGVSDAAATG